MQKIAIIDDDAYISDMLAELLTKEGYAVVCAYSGTEALMLLSREQPDLILLDLMMPGISGEEVLKKIQDIPVIILSAKADIQHKVALLLDGAVDYVTKPFHVEELLARITVQLRRHESHRTRRLCFAEITLDLDSHMAWVSDVPVKLTKTEYAILKLLLQNPNQVMTKSAMLDRISEDTPDCVESSLKVHVSNLRRKLREVSGKDYIEAVWGIGFRLQDTGATQ